MPTLPWTPTPEARSTQSVTVLAMVTLLELNTFRDTPGFLRTALGIRRQVLRSPGALGVSLIARPMKRAYWTLSAWTDRTAMNNFIRSEPHLGSMGKYRTRMSQFRFVSYELPIEALPPSWEDARRRLSDDPQ